MPKRTLFFPYVVLFWTHKWCHSEVNMIIIFLDQKGANTPESFICKEYCCRLDHVVKAGSIPLLQPQLSGAEHCGGPSTCLIFFQVLQGPHWNSLSLLEHLNTGVTWSNTWMSGSALRWRTQAVRVVRGGDIHLQPQRTKVGNWLPLLEWFP